MLEEAAILESPESSLVSDAVSEETVETESPEVAQAETSEQPETETAEVADDGRKIPPSLRDIFKADSKLRDRWFKGASLMERFPEGPKQAEALITAVESITSQLGVESLDDIMPTIEKERGYWQELDQHYIDGKPEFINELYDVNPEAFAKMMPLALETLVTKDADTYNHLMARVVVNTLDRSPLVKIYEALAADEKTKGAADELAKWYRNIEQLANKQPERKIDPEREKFEQEKKSFEDQKAQEYNNQATEKMRQFNARLIEDLLSKEYARIGKKLAIERKANPETYNIIAKNCRDAIFEIISADQNSLKQYSALLATGDMQKALAFAQAKVRKLAPNAVNRIFKVFNRNLSVKKPVVNQTGQFRERGSGDSGSVNLGRTPKHEEIDWPRMRAHGLDGVTGQVYLKGQKQLYSF